MRTPAPSTPAFNVHPLVTGGADPIDSHMAKHGVWRGCDVGTLDKLSTGHRNALLSSAFMPADLAERDRREAVFSNCFPEAAFRFTSFIQAGESVNEPAKYHHNDVVNTLKRDRLAQPPKRSSDGWTSAQTRFLILFTAKQTRAVTP